ncbi:hypothetical protein C0J50_21120 [Silurus asotus]|uniref:Endonuclease/exonuclease/phosphatase domain-containing protein n=1 Tax=Silurus asotus TaxID=30991 RepID=A0AAD5ANQ2_SILAS|nr:hypothetical protein C0J50_21120 [Silurus asotus]
MARKVRRPSGKWSKARNIGGGFKLFYHGVNGRRNGVGVILKEEYSKCVVEVKRVSDRVMIVKLEVEGVMINVISAYASQVGCEMEEKEKFWSKLDEVVTSEPKNKRLVIGADFNGHVKRSNLKVIEDYKVLVVCRMVLEVKKKRRRVKTERRIRWWKLKEEECSVRFREKVDGGEEMLATNAEVMRDTARKVLGVTSGNRKKDKETWWWNEEVRDSIRKKRLAKQNWDQQLYEKLDTKLGEKDLYRFVRQRDRAGKDVLQRRDMSYISKRMLRMEPPGRRKRGRPKRRFMDSVKKDMQVVGWKEADIEDRGDGIPVYLCRFALSFSPWLMKEANEREALLVPPRNTLPI